MKKRERNTRSTRGTRIYRWSSALSFLCLLCSFPVFGETGHDVWLRYAQVPNVDVPPVIVSLSRGPVAQTAEQELIRGIRGMLGRTLRVGNSISAEPSIVLRESTALPPDGYSLKSERANGVPHIIISAANDAGLLYGAFALLRKIALSEPITSLDIAESPAAPLRWVNEWDNINGTIERGYGGPSIFWEGGHVRTDLSRVNDYGRMLASIGINGCSINNVNADTKFLTPELLPQIARIADVLRPWGVKVAIAVDFGSPKSVGGLDTFDPVDPSVANWWKSKADEIYRLIPDFGGFVLKADSEGRVGPSTYGRTHADAANVVARALKPHGGVLFYRGFVYDHHMDWQNPKNDRARAAYDNFHELDGKFDDNVIIQIKNGPIDFQVREPASPLFGGMEHTRESIELQITQEYFGQARHLVFLPSMWKETLDFDLHLRDRSTPVKKLVSAFSGVSNVGMDESWYGNHMSQANLYGFGRLAWNPDLTAKQISEEWTRLTFGNDPLADKTINEIQLSSWRTFENYTGPLGLQTLTDIVGNHYGVAVEASERNGWGQWHKADEKGVGFDRTVATGTGFLGQYSPAVTKMYEAMATCPDDLVLFMHHVPYTYRLHDGKTVIQYIYDSHYDGADAVAKYVSDWKALKGRVDDARYEQVLKQLEYQAGQSIVWRDAVNNWFFKESGIVDSKGRVGNHPGRFEAEAMTLTGYVAKPVTPWETASGGTAVECATAKCTASIKYTGMAGRHDLVVQYFDLPDGMSTFQAWIGNQLVDEWTASDRLPARKIDSSSSSRRIIRGIALRPGDEIRIEGTPDGRESAALDYIEIQ